MLKVGSKHIRSGQISVITKIGSPTLYTKVISLGNIPIPGVKVGDLQKTNIHVIGKTYELIKENKMKLTLKERKLVKEYAKSLIEKKVLKENEDLVYFVIDNGKLDDTFLDNKQLSDKLEYKHLSGGDVLYSLNQKDYDRFVDWATSSGYESGANPTGDGHDDFYEVDEQGNQIEIEYDPEDYDDMNESKKIKGKKIIKENNTYTMISALREIADDLLLQTELLIDRQYGQLDHNKFKNEWYKNANEFEKKFKVIIKSLMKTGK